ncbi:MATE family efflux transporter [Segatella salivae]|uniref:MATE family efflux transporter n=1 Tax=Segatella salivae TaxID=228604 RepID=UPI001CB5C444|nr:MATE family efflux transporter [Segatella salivae]MBF1555625.1 MATE family efflux transporter [Segatella salivae]
MLDYLKKYTAQYPYLVRIGVPITIGQLGVIVLGFADTLMIGHHSLQELAAASFVTNMFTLALLFGLGFSYGLTPIIGKLYGQGKKGEIGAALKVGLASGAVLALVLMLAMGLLYLNIGRLGQPEELLSLMRPYFVVNFVSIPFVVLFNTMKQFYDGKTETIVPMMVMIIGNVLNIIGNYLLIYGKLGLPEWGLFGAGVSTFLSRVFMSFVLVILFFRRRYSAYRRGLFEAKVSRKDFIYQNKQGWPLALQMGMETAAFSLSSVMVGWIGTVSLATHQVMLTISQLGYMLYYGMAAAVAIRVSYYHGQKDYANCNTTARAGMQLILLMAVVVSIPIFCFRNVIGGLFTDSQEVIGMVSLTIIPFIIYQFGDGMQANYANALRGLSNVKPLMLVAFLAYFVITLPLGYVFGIVFNGGLVGIWSAFPFGLTVAGVLYRLYFQKTLRKEERLM